MNESQFFEMRPVTEPKYYTVNEAANIFRVGHAAVRSWIRQGKIKSVKIGGKVLIPAAEILKVGGGQ